MPADSSFDIVSKLDRQEVDNALNQAGKEISTRFDFRNVGASIAWSGDHAVEIRANSEERAKAVLDVFKDKLVKRGVSLKVLDASDPKLSGKEYRLSIALKENKDQRTKWRETPLPATLTTFRAAMSTAQGFFRFFHLMARFRSAHNCAPNGIEPMR